jgi:hypothetical protein
VSNKINLNIRDEIKLWANGRYFLISSGYVLLFILVVIAHSNLARHATSLAPTGGLSDFFLNILPYKDTTFFHDNVSNYIKWIGQIFILFLPRFLPFMLLAHMCLIITRGLFINLTQLPPPDGMLPISSFNTFGGDLFFSGHVALPFLYALVFWDIKPIRYIFLIASALFGITTLFGRYHYSIDVFSALFIAYGIYVIASRVFTKTYLQTKTTEVVL